MALQIGALEIVFRTDLDSLTSGMRNASAVVEQGAARVGRATSGAERNVTSLERSLGAFRGGDAFRALSISALRAEDATNQLRAGLLLLPAAIGGIGLATAVRTLAQYADTATQVRNRLGVLTNSMADRVTMEREIFDIAQRTRTTYQATAQLFSRTTQAAQNLGRSQAQVGQFVETVAMTAQISGSSTQESQASAIQLAQGLASNRLQGDELRSILENNVALAQVLAKELAGGDIGRLREMGTSGLLTAQQVLDAVLRSSVSVAAQFARTQATVANGLVIVTNALTRYVGQMDEAVGASQAIFNLMSGLANNIPQVANGLLLLASAAAAVGAVRLTQSLASPFRGAANARSAELSSAASEAGGRVSVTASALKDAQARLVAANEAVEKASRSAFGGASTEAFGNYQRAAQQSVRLQEELARRTAAIETAERSRGRAVDAVARAQAAADAAGVASTDRLLRARERLVTAESTLASRQAALLESQGRVPDVQSRVSAAGRGVSESAEQNRAATIRAQADAQRSLAQAASEAARAQGQFVIAQNAAERGAGLFGTAIAGARNVVGSLVGFLGGPWGVAFTALAVTLAAVGLAHADAAAKAREQEDNLNRLTKAMDLVTEATKRQQALTPQQTISARSDLIAGEAGIAGSVDQLRGFTANSLFGGNFDRGLNTALARRGGDDLRDFDDQLRDARGNVEQTERVLANMRRELEAVGTARPDLSQPIAEMLRLINTTTRAINQVRALRAAINGSTAGIDIEGEVENARERGIVGPINRAADDFQRQVAGETPLDAQVQTQAFRIREQQRLQEELIRNNGRSRGGRAALLEVNRRQARAEFATGLNDGSISEADIERLVQSRTPEERRERRPRSTQERWTAEQRVFRELADGVRYARGQLTEIDRETLNYARSARLSEESARSFVDAVTSGRLDQAPEQYRRIREQVIEIKKAQLGRDLGFEREQLFRSPEEQQVQQRLRGAGLTEGMAQQEAASMRLNQSLSTTRDLFQSAFQGVGQMILQGASAADILAASLQRVLGNLISIGERWAAQQLFNLFTSSFGGGVATGAPTNLLGFRADSGGSMTGPGSMVSYGPRTSLNRFPIVADSGMGPKNFPAILEYGERVLTETMGGRTDRALVGMSNALAAQGNPGGGGVSVIEIALSPEVIARVLDQAAGQSIKITSTALTQFSERVPAIVANSEMRR